VAHPREQIYLASSPILATIIVSNAPFSADDLTRLHTATSELGFTELASPDRDPGSPALTRILNATTAAELDDLDGVTGRQQSSVGVGCGRPSEWWCL
jgi:hypothetical protein